MTQLLDIFGFLSVLLRGLTLVCEALVVGGVIFRLAIARGIADVSLTRKISRFVGYAAVFFAFVQACYVAANSAILMGTTDLGWADVRGAQFCVAGALIAAGALVVAGLIQTRWAMAACPVACGLILAGTVMTSHSMARLEHRTILPVLTLAHHVAGAAWIGGIPYLLISLKGISGSGAAKLASRFSKMAMLSVATLVCAGTLMGYFYVGSTGALVGTTYGIMLLAKVVLTGLLLSLGWLNRNLLKQVRQGMGTLLKTLGRFAEAEIGIGFTVLLTAASLTSTPPAIDVQADRVSLTEIAARNALIWPRMKTPALADLSPATPLETGPSSAQPGSFVPGQLVHPNTPADIAWSEYNHHWAGLIVLAIGILSLQAHRFTWARNWPLLFLGLAVFLFLRADSENWPLGPRSFWESFQVAEVAQHRLFVLLIVAFAVFEWSVQTGRLSVTRAGLVFPLVCAVGGALLLTHQHSLGNVKDEFLAELSHIPLAIFAVIAGWSRWLVIRLPRDRVPAIHWVAPVCFILIGAVLMNYREG